MQTVRTSIDIPIGGKLKLIINITDAETGEPFNFEGLTGTLKMKNVFEEAEDKKVYESTSAVEFEPEDSEGNKKKGVISLNIDVDITSKLEIPENESDPFGESGFYSVIQIIADDGQIPAIFKIRPIQTI